MGYDNQGIWVDNNCKARFSYKQGLGQSDRWQDNNERRDANRSNDGRHDNDHNAGTSRTVKCKSKSKDKKVCAKNIRKADLVREISKDKYPCRKNWGIDRSGDLFVKNKCYAEFKVWD